MNVVPLESMAVDPECGAALPDPLVAPVDPGDLGATSASAARRLWLPLRGITLYPSPGSRMHVRMEVDPKAPESTDPTAAVDGLIFAQALLETLSGHVTPLTDMAIALELIRSLTHWQVQRAPPAAASADPSSDPDPVGDLLRLLLSEHAAALEQVKDPQ